MVKEGAQKWDTSRKQGGNGLSHPSRWAELCADGKRWWAVQVRGSDVWGGYGMPRDASSNFSFCGKSVKLQSGSFSSSK